MNEYAQAVLQELRCQRPDWAEGAGPDESMPEHLLARIVPPDPATPAISISTELDELIVYFGPAHLHVGQQNKPIAKQVQSLISMLDPIIKEEMIAAEFWSRFGFTSGGWITPKEYEKRLAKGRLAQSRSWNGTYNFDKASNNGLHGTR